MAASAAAVTAAAASTAAWATAPAAVTFDVYNVGARDGEEVAQLYIEFPAAAGEPPQVLRGFAKYLIPQGFGQAIQLALTPRDLSIWDVDAYSWQLQKGTFGVAVGASSRDIRLRGSFTL